jgi:hypothetical protein
MAPGYEYYFYLTFLRKMACLGVLSFSTGLSVTSYSHKMMKTSKERTENKKEGT